MWKVKVRWKLKPNSKLCILWEMVPGNSDSLGFTCSPWCYSAAWSSEFEFFSSEKPIKLFPNRYSKDQKCVPYCESGGYIDPGGAFWVPARFWYWAEHKAESYSSSGLHSLVTGKKRYQKQLTSPFAVIMWGSQHQFWTLLDFFPKNSLPGHF